MEKVYPTLSLKTRDHRWGLAKKMMKEKGLDCLIVKGQRELFEGWLANDNGGTVIFPLEGEPSYMVWSPMHGLFRDWEDRKRGGASWIDDYRVAGGAKGLADILQEKGLESATIGVVGLGGGQAQLAVFSYELWSGVLEQLPNATFIDVVRPFVEMMLPKIEEELVLVRHCAQIGEMACEVMIKVIRAGVSESEIYAAIMETIFRNGAGARGVILQTGIENLGWGTPIWTYRAGHPPVLGKGDLATAELFTRYGGFETQQPITVVTKPVAPLTQELADVARRSYEAAVKFIEPGKTFGELCDVMNKPLEEAGCWHMTPLAHSLNPPSLLSRRQTALEQFPEFRDALKLTRPPSAVLTELVLSPGMVLCLEPPAWRGKHHVLVGGTVVVTEDGVEELNKLSAEMQIGD